MKFHRIAIALAAFSIAGGAIAAGSPTTTTTAPSASSSQTTTTSPSSADVQGYSAGQAGAASAEQGNPTLVRSVQQALNQKGYDAGSSDGQMGPSTQKALRDFQQAQGLPQSGSLDAQTLSALGVDQSQGAMQDQGSSTMQGQDRLQNAPATPSMPPPSTTSGASNTSPAK